MSKRKTTQEFILEASSIFNGRYLYDKSSYVNNATKVIITCRQHGDFEMKPNNHLSLKNGCRKCSDIKGGRSYRRFAKLNRLNTEQIITPEGSVAVGISNGLYAIVDEEDFEKVSKFNWSVNNGYARHGKSSMHRFILNLYDLSMDIDHINGNKLDNRKTNLRICTRQQNLANVPPRKNKSSIYKGVTKRHKGLPWSSQIVKDKQLIHIGNFQSEKEAAIAYDKKAFELYGEFAWLNFPEALQSTEKKD